MNIFKKLFRRRKNTINLSAEEAYAADSRQEEELKADSLGNTLPGGGADREALEPEKNKPESIASETAADAAEEKEVGAAPNAQRDIRPDDGNDPIASREIQDPEAREFTARVYCPLAGPDAAREPLRLMLREAANGFCEDGDGFRAALADGCEARMAVCAVGEALAGLSEKTEEGISDTIRNIMDFLPALNVRVDISILSGREEAAKAFAARAARSLGGYWSLDGEALYDPEGKLLLSRAGQSEFEVPEVKTRREGEERPGAEEASEDLGEEDAEEVPKEAAAEEIRNEQTPAGETSDDGLDSAARRRKKSEELISAQGIALGYSTAARLDEDALILPAESEIIQRACALMYVSHAARLNSAGNGITVASRNTGLLARLDERFEIRSEFTAKENAYLRGASNESHASFAARCEGSALLMWALGLFDLAWPKETCDTAALLSLFRENDLAALTRRARLRSTDELLDMYDLTTRLHSVCVHASRRELREMPIDAEIIYERHYALNWLLGVGGRVAWDKVIPTT